MSPTQLDLMQLGLEGNAWAAAREFVQHEPNARITSGRRTLSEQADAMAANVVESGWKWLRVYKYIPIRTALIQWCRRHPEAKTKNEIAIGLLSVLRTFPDAELMRLSAHLSGHAFDVQPVFGHQGSMMLNTLRSVIEKYGGTLLEKEGGLVRWHAQF